MTTTPNRTESILIALFVSVACPYSTFVLAWWGSVFVNASEKVVSYSALTGLGLGLLLLVVGWRRWIRNFYNVRTALALLVYLFWSVIALASFMGVPIGNLVLGSLAGLYFGRRALHHGVAPPLFKRQVQWVGWLTAALVGFIAVVMGLLAVQERETMRVILGLVGLGQLAATTTGRIVLVVVAVPVLIAIQYWLTRVMADWGFRVGHA
jgi:hypothetical protein